MNQVGYLQKTDELVFQQRKQSNFQTIVLPENEERPESLTLWAH